jgi:hypothetical protein
MALAKALVREARSEEERAFLLSELALELARVQPEAKAGCLAPDLHQAEIRKVIEELRNFVPEIGSEGPANLKQYVASVFDSVLS